MAQDVTYASTEHRLIPLAEGMEYISKPGVGRCYLRERLLERQYEFVFEGKEGNEEVMFIQRHPPTRSQLITWIGFARQMRFGERS